SLICCFFFFFFSSRRRHTRFSRDWSSDVCSSDLNDGQSSQELLQNADIAMYHAKSKGGQNYQFFNESMNRNAVRRLQVESQLRQALRNNHVRVLYQPKVALHNLEYVGVEALARLQIPGVGMMSPVEFIPLAEETGLIIEMGEQ